MNETKTEPKPQVSSTLATPAEVHELLVDGTEVKVKADTRSAAVEIVALNARIQELMASVRTPELRLAHERETRGGTPVVWVNPKGTMMIARLVFSNLFKQGDTSVVQCRVLKGQDNTLRYFYFRDDYRRGLLEGEHKARNTRPSRDEYRDKARSDFLVTGALASATREFLEPTTLKPALEAAGFVAEAQRFYGGAPQTNPAGDPLAAPPKPDFADD